MADQKPPTGSFSDLYEAMQQRKEPAVTHPIATPKESVRGGVGKEGSREVGKETSLPAKRERGKSPFNLNERPYRKDSFLFTDAEFHALEQLKLDIRSKEGLPATKNDLARCAIGRMLADYAERGEDSFVVRLLRAKASR